jgi:hypothetical protein
VHKKAPLLLLAFAILLNFTGCSSMSAQARRERAYRHYLAKQMKHRQRQIARAQKAANRNAKRKMKNLQPSDPMLTTTLEESSPQAMSAPEPRRAPPVYSEPVADPITVSASGSMPSDPSQP